MLNLAKHVHTITQRSINSYPNSSPCTCTEILDTEKKEAALYQLLSLGAKEGVDSDDEGSRCAEDFQELPWQDGDVGEAGRKNAALRHFEGKSKDTFIDYTFNINTKLLFCHH